MLDINNDKYEVKEIMPSNLYAVALEWDANEMMENIMRSDIQIGGIISVKKCPAVDRFAYVKSFVKRMLRGKAENFDKTKTYDYLSVGRFEEAINVILGFSVLGYQGVLADLVRNPKIVKIYIPNGASYLYGNKFEFPDRDKIVLMDDYLKSVIARDLTYDYFKQEKKKFVQTYEWLSDKCSKRTMELYLDGLINWKPFPLMEVWRHEEVESQYFAKDIVALSDNEVFVDCGAYTGDTLMAFDKRVSRFKKYYAWEPDARRYRKLKRSINRVKGTVIHIKKGVWNESGTLCLAVNKGCGEIRNETQAGKGIINIAVDTIDNIVDAEDKVTFIKMDIEGSELNALMGAKNTIIKNRPILAICVYHKREDLITIPQYIKGLNTDYKFYLRAYYPYCSELVLYAICE